jgi:hypothetical protein
MEADIMRRYIKNFHHGVLLSYGQLGEHGERKRILKLRVLRGYILLKIHTWWIDHEN